MRRPHRPMAAVLVAVLIGAALTGAGAFAASPPPKAGADHRALATPDLIQHAVESGRLTRATGDLYLAYALAAPGKLPNRFRSDVPWEATLAVLRLQRRIDHMQAGSARDRLESVLNLSASGEALAPGLGTCFVSVAPMPETHESEHFYIEYNPATIRGGLTIDDYAASLEGAWATEVTAFGWAAPPVLTSNPPPGGKYHVRIDELSPVIYGFVSNEGSHAGSVGNNPNTPWNDQDADASCMVLNADFDAFPGTAQQAMDATTAHEFNHSLQFGYGGLSGANTPDDAFIEGGATWMEDEVYDESNDNYNYLWPTFEDDMGEYEDSPYPYWVTFRGLTERYGAGVPGGGEDVMQSFWELTSRNRASNLEALNLALRAKGTNLADAYHAYAIAVKFNRACTGGYTYPYCFEEGPAYVAAAGETEPHGSIAAVGESHEGTVPDNYALNWVTLPTGTQSYRVTLVNASVGGELRGTVVCDTGSGFSLFPFNRVVRAGGSGTLSSFNPTGCLSVVAVITNQAQTAANPDASEDRLYRVLTAQRRR